MMSACLFTEAKRQWAQLVVGWVTTSVHYFLFVSLMALQLTLVDQNPFRPCLSVSLRSCVMFFQQRFLRFNGH